MKQLIDNLIKSGVNRKHILFFSFDEARPRLQDVIENYQQMLGQEIVFNDTRFFIFLDEVQKLKDWQSQIKYYYDHYKIPPIQNE